MNSFLLPLLELQGEIKIRLIKANLPQEEAHQLAYELLDLIANSKAVKPEIQLAYREIDSQ